MSIYGMIRTSISGMSAQAYRLTAVSDNIANADTTGYKRSSMEFSSLVMPGGGSGNASLYESGSVVPHTRKAIAEQGTFRYTSSPTDLAIEGNGFFVVRNDAGTPLLTRSGSFVADREGNLANSANFHLQGYPIVNGQVQNVVNGYSGLEKVNIRSFDLVAIASTEGVLTVNLPSGDAVTTGALPSSNSATSTFSQKSSLTSYDSLGNSKIVDVYMTKTSADTWQISVFDQAEAAATGAPFPYSSGPLATTNLTFSLSSGKLIASSPQSITFTVPNGAPLTLDLAATTQLGTGYVVSEATINGNAPATIDRTEIRSDGTLFAGYTDGSFKPLFKIPIATVISPDRLAPVTGTAFSVTADSGDVVVGFAGEGSAGRVISSALEQSNVDIAEELTAMIQAQRGYSANSKVFQTGSEVTEIAINLKR